MTCALHKRQFLGLLFRVFKAAMLSTRGFVALTSSMALTACSMHWAHGLAQGLAS